MGCDPILPYTASPWELNDIPYDEWFELFPVDLRRGDGIVCGICGAQVAVKGARLHKEWHERH